MSDKYELYGFPVSPFSYLVNATLEYKGLNYENNIVNLRKGEQKHPEYLEINPYGLVPCIKFGETSIYESWAIFEYLEEKHPDKSMLPKDAIQKSKVRSVGLTITNELIPLTAQLLRDQLGMVPLSKERKEQVINNLEQKLSVFSNELKKVKDFCEFSPIEPLFFQAWMNVTFLLPNLKEEYPTLTEYYQQLIEHPSIQSIEQNPKTIEVRNLMRDLFMQKA
ncbi:MAG: glutathione S-transferase family protein [Candidatus Caenarcaniphilales bacterium]|nr:glutathione S-transferase family protein [Candidatus Caenarcaniphilales bacterium]